MTDFEKIIKVTRMAKRDAICTKEQSFLASRFPSLSLFLGVPFVGANIWLSYKVISAMFSDHKAYIAIKWYDTVYNLRMN